MTSQEILIIISSILVFVSYLIYEWSIITGRTKPHRTTRFVLVVISFLGAISLFAGGSSAAFWLIAINSFHCFFVFLLSFKYGMGGWAKTDLLCFAIAAIGIATWQLTDNPALGLYAAVAADFAGMIPALIKTYRLPHTEFYLSYIFDDAAAIFTLLAITQKVPQEYLYPAYILAINIVMPTLALRPQIKKLLATS